MKQTTPLCINVSCRTPAAISNGNANDAAADDTTSNINNTTTSIINKLADSINLTRVPVSTWDYFLDNNFNVGRTGTGGERVRVTRGDHFDDDSSSGRSSRRRRTSSETNNNNQQQQLRSRATRISDTLEQHPEELIPLFAKHMEPRHVALLPHMPSESVRARLRTESFESAVQRLTTLHDDVFDNGSTNSTNNNDDDDLHAAASLLSQLVAHQLVPLDAVMKVVESLMKGRRSNSSSSHKSNSSNGISRSNSGTTGTTTPTTTSSRVGVSLLCQLAETVGSRDDFAKTVGPLQSVLHSLSNADPTYDYDNAYLSRRLGWKLPGPQLLLLYEIDPSPSSSSSSSPSSSHNRPVVSGTYVGGGVDELVTSQLDGTLSVWGGGGVVRQSINLGGGGRRRGITAGGPLSSSSSSRPPSASSSSGPSSQHDVAPDHATSAVCLDSLKNTAGIVVACSSPLCSSSLPAPPPPPPAILFCTRSNDKDNDANDGADDHRREGGGKWRVTEIVKRTDCSLVSCVKRTDSKQDTVCVGETQHHQRDAPHRLTFISPTTGHCMRTIPQAHGDTITCIAPSSDEAWLVSGSRDTTVKMFDARAPGGALHDLTAHKDTVTSVNTSGDYLITGSADQRVCLWDSRRLKKPLVEKAMAGPVLKTCVVTGGTSHPVVAAAIPDGLFLLAMSNLTVEDAIGRVSVLDLKSSTVENGASHSSLLFGMGATISLFSTDNRTLA